MEFRSVVGRQTGDVVMLRKGYIEGGKMRREQRDRLSEVGRYISEGRRRRARGVR